MKMKIWMVAITVMAVVSFFTSAYVAVKLVPEDVETYQNRHATPAWHADSEFADSVVATQLAIYPVRTPKAENGPSE